MINSTLTQFAKDLVIARNSNEKEKIDRSISALIGNIEKYLGNDVEDIQVFGSYARNTILPRAFDPNSDVDLMVVFNTDNRELSPQTYRKKLHDVVRSYYPRSYSQKDAPAVKLELNHIKFDLVPAIIEPETWWRNEKCYVPDGLDWVETDPFGLNEELTAANKKYGSNLVRHVVRLCKHWNAGAGHPLKSYLMEQKISRLNFNGDDTYAGFLHAMDKVAGDFAQVSQALNWIREYEDRQDEDKQLQWLQKLLPEL